MDITFCHLLLYDSDDSFVHWCDCFGAVAGVGGGVAGVGGGDAGGGAVGAGAVAAVADVADADI